MKRKRNNNSNEGNKRGRSSQHRTDGPLNTPSQKYKENETESQDDSENFDVLDDEEDEYLEDDMEDIDNFIDKLEKGRKEWRRGICPPVDSEKNDLIFQELDADYVILPARAFDNFRYLGAQHDNRKGRNPSVPVVRFYGITKNKNSVMCNIWGFQPYFYINVPQGFNLNTCDQLTQFLNNHFEKTEKKTPGAPFIQKIHPIEKMSLWKYQFNEKKTFLKVITGIPGYVRMIRKKLENGLVIPGLSYVKFQTYESNILFILRNMIDYNLTPCSWMKVNKGKYYVEKSDSKSCTCDIEIHCSNQGIECLDPIKEENSSIAPLRILSFDIECLGWYDKDKPVRGKKGKVVKKKKKKVHFAQADKDQCCVIQIANTVTIQGEDSPFIKNVFVLNTCSDIAGAEVLSFQKEEDLLLEWAKFVRQVDPDIITGYNIINFDIPYLLDRAKFLQKKVGSKMAPFFYLGRIKKHRAAYKKSQFSSNQMGTRATHEITIRGRILLDVLNYVLREHKLSSYTLNNVSAHFLKQQKEDVHYSIMNKLQEKSRETRKRLAVYCLKDALLPQRLIDKLMIIFNSFEMSRVCGVPVEMILSRGQQIKVIVQLLKEARKKGLIMPTFTPGSGGGEKKFVGATVLQPKPGFYQKHPICTLDFASLYPSIMIAHNICYTTMVHPSNIGKFKQDELTKTPLGFYFVKQNVYRGLLPDILLNLLNARKKAKSDLGKAKDPIMKAVLNGRQLALKVSANSVYGFTGASKGALPLVAISASVTAFGRKMIDQTKNWVEETYSVRNGFRHNSEVIYGDTDSVMIKFGVKTVKESIELGLEAGKLITKELFQDPISLQFEKVYLPYLLLAKKNYAGLLFTKAETWDKIDTKGIETVRRDKCGVVRNLMSTCLHLILIKKETEKAIQYVKEVIRVLLLNKMDISQLVISKTLSKKEYVNKQPHSVLAEVLKQRNPATAPKQGDRVNFVFVNKGGKAFEMAEDPMYALENRVPINVRYYVEHKLKSSIRRLFEMVISEKQLKEIFVGEHTRKIVQTAPKRGGMMNYTKKKIVCLKKGCKVGVKKTESVCPQHRGDVGAIYEKILNKKNHLEMLYGKAWSHCQRCQESFLKMGFCMNEDCPIFYMRTQVKVELKEQQDLLKRFHDESVYDW